MKDFFKKIENKIKGLHKSRLINPHIHWAMLVRLFLLLSLLLIAFGFFLLYQIRSAQIFQVVPSVTENPPSLIKEKLLENITEAFKNKEIRTGEIRSGQILFSDPS